jgi:anti-anti-sigma factor
MRIARDGSVARVELDGELDIVWRRKHEAEIRELCTGSQKVVIFDVRKVTFVDSSGLGVLALCAQPLGAVACSAFVVGANARVRRTLEIAGLTSLLKPVESETEVSMSH